MPLPTIQDRVMTPGARQFWWACCKLKLNCLGNAVKLLPCKELLRVSDLVLAVNAALAAYAAGTHRRISDWMPANQRPSGQWVPCGGPSDTVMIHPDSMCCQVVITEGPGGIDAPFTMQINVMGEVDYRGCWELALVLKDEVWTIVAWANEGLETTYRTLKLFDEAVAEGIHNLRWSREPERVHVATWLENMLRENQIELAPVPVPVPVPVSARVRLVETA